MPGSTIHGSFRSQLALSPFLVVGTLGLVMILYWGSTSPVLALEKYGRPLPSIGEEQEEGVAGGGPQEEQWLQGYLLSAAFVDNPTFAARPNNTGLVGMRYMLHLETELYKEYLQVYTDQNFFSDRTNGWIKLSEWDATVALTGALGRWGWRLQYERDAPLDTSGIKQIYADTLITYRPTAMNTFDWWRARFPSQNLSTYAGAGWLFYNQNYFARPDNTGRALFRYVAHADLDLYKNKVVFFADTNFFTNRDSSNKLLPTELDLVIGLAFRYKDAELAVIHEQDMPLDQGGLVQRYTAIQLRYAFEWIKNPLKKR